jgi:hypothetical protein
MKDNRLEGAIHPPYSQDLAPSDFYLFSYVKHCLRGQSFETADELFLAINAVLRGIEKWTLRAAVSNGCRDSDNVLKPMVTIVTYLDSVAAPSLCPAQSEPYRMRTSFTTPAYLVEPLESSWPRIRLINGTTSYGSKVISCLWMLLFPNL